MSKSKATEQQPDGAESTFIAEIIPESTDRLGAIAAEIRTKDHEALAAVWSTGKLLAEARPLCPRGTWSQWLSNNFGWSLSYAARLIRIAEEYPEALPSGLGVSTLLCTLPLEESLRERLNKFIVEAELSQAEARAVVESVKVKEQKLTEWENRLQSGEFAETVRAEIRAELESQMQAQANPDKDELASLDKANRELSAEIKKQSAKAARADKLESELNTLRAQSQTMRENLIRVNDELEKVKSAPVQAAAPVRAREVRVEVAPADYEELKKQAAKVKELELALAASKSAQSDESEIFKLRELVDKLRKNADLGLVKMEAVLHDRRIYRERILYLEKLLTEAGVKFDPTEFTSPLAA